MAHGQLRQTISLNVAPAERCARCRSGTLTERRKEYLDRTPCEEQHPGRAQKKTQKPALDMGFTHIKSPVTDDDTCQEELEMKGNLLNNSFVSGCWRSHGNAVVNIADKLSFSADLLTGKLEQRTGLSDKQHKRGSRAVTEDCGFEAKPPYLFIDMLGAVHNPSHEPGQVIVPRGLGHGLGCYLSLTPSRTQKITNSDGR
jgi:hypothetical protein